MPQIKVILLDLGNVVVDFDHLIAARRIAQFCAMKPEEIFSLFFASGITTRFEEGKISPGDFFAEVKKTLGLSLSFESFKPIWNEIFFLTPQNHAVLKIASKLRFNYSLAMATNINTLHYEYLKVRFPVFVIFEKVFASCEMGMAKPNPVFYRKITGELAVAAENIFYTDDRPELVEAAKALGIRGFVYKGPEQLKRDLDSSGVELS